MLTRRNGKLLRGRYAARLAAGSVFSRLDYYVYRRCGGVMAKQGRWHCVQQSLPIVWAICVLTVFTLQLFIRIISF